MTCMLLYYYSYLIFSLFSSSVVYRSHCSVLVFSFSPFWFVMLTPNHTQIVFGESLSELYEKVVLSDTVECVLLRMGCRVVMLPTYATLTVNLHSFFSGMIDEFVLRRCCSFEWWVLGRCQDGGCAMLRNVR